MESPSLCRMFYAVNHKDNIKLSVIRKHLRGISQPYHHKEIDSDDEYSDDEQSDDNNQEDSTFALLWARKERVYFNPDVETRVWVSEGKTLIIGKPNPELVPNIMFRFLLMPPESYVMGNIKYVYGGYLGHRIKCIADIEKKEHPKLEFINRDSCAYYTKTIFFGDTIEAEIYDNGLTVFYCGTQNETNINKTWEFIKECVVPFI